MNLKNKKVLITGATGGIGNSLIEKFNNLGSLIIATGTNEEKLNNLKEKYPNINIERFKLEEGGIVPRQGYFGGSFVKAVTKPIKKVVTTFYLFGIQ